MSTRERAKAILAGAVWLIPGAIAVVLGDTHKMFILAVSGAAVFTLSTIILTAMRRSTAAATSAAAAAAASAVTAIEELGKKLLSSEFPVPVQVVHQIGFKQGWEARDLQGPDCLSDLVAVFEKRFPAPPN